ncbi:hypothetical protein LTS18_007830 [Coniosporium uncinatum]|uniref:Uncharacterized protein n=1 Tax=Coniosporium uncinatum TaxID=93489 RepID=A0ACC3E059_9PEZI|nr:hypothetical protein LTS18_007830 [Coniosporium uncinatum]
MKSCLHAHHIAPAALRSTYASVRSISWWSRKTMLSRGDPRFHKLSNDNYRIVKHKLWQALYRKPPTPSKPMCWGSRLSSSWGKPENRQYEKAEPTTTQKRGQSIPDEDHYELSPAERLWRMRMHDLKRRLNEDPFNTMFGWSMDRLAGVKPRWTPVMSNQPRDSRPESPSSNTPNVAPRAESKSARHSSDPLGSTPGDRSDRATTTFEYDPISGRMTPKAFQSSVRTKDVDNSSNRAIEIPVKPFKPRDERRVQPVNVEASQCSSSEYPKPRLGNEVSHDELLRAQNSLMIDTGRDPARDALKNPHVNTTDIEATSAKTWLANNGFANRLPGNQAKPLGTGTPKSDTQSVPVPSRPKLPKDDIDLLDSSDIRARMGRIRHQPSESGEARSLRRSALEESFDLVNKKNVELAGKVLQERANTDARQMVTKSFEIPKESPEASTTPSSKDPLLAKKRRQFLAERFSQPVDKYTAWLPGAPEDYQRSVAAENLHNQYQEKANAMQQVANEVKNLHKLEARLAAISQKLDTNQQASKRAVEVSAAVTKQHKMLEGNDSAAPPKDNVEPTRPEPLEPSISRNVGRPARMQLRKLTAEVVQVDPEEVKRSVEQTAKTNRLQRQLEEEIQSQKTAMQAIEYKPSSSGKPTATEKARNDDWQQARWEAHVTAGRTDPRKLEAEKQKQRDNALVKEIRNIYEEHYGPITAKHQQNDVASSAKAELQVSEPKPFVPQATMVEPKKYTELTEEDKKSLDAYSMFFPSEAQVDEPSSIDKPTEENVARPASLQEHNKREADKYMTTLPSDHAEKGSPSETTPITQIPHPTLLEASSPTRPETAANVTQSTGTSSVPAEASLLASDPTDVRGSATLHPTSTEAVYRVLAYDPSSKTITAATTSSSSSSSSDAPIPLTIALTKLSYPAKFLPHLPTLRETGFEPVKAADNLLILKKIKDVPLSKQTEGEHTPEPASAKKLWADDVNPVDGTTTAAVAAAQNPAGNFASPTGFVNHDVYEPPSSFSSSFSPPSSTSSSSTGAVGRGSAASGSVAGQYPRPRRLEPVFSGKRHGHGNGDGKKERRRRKRWGRRVLFHGATAVVALYAAGAWAEWQRGREWERAKARGVGCIGE